MYLGDFAAGATVDFTWCTQAADGSAVDRTVNGTISVYKGNGTTQSTAGVTDLGGTSPFDSVTGLNQCRITTVTDGTFYATGNEFSVVLTGATIDGKTVTATIATFSIGRAAANLLDLANGIETSITLRQALRLILAEAAGKVSGGGTSSVVIRNVGDTKDRISATCDSSGNRSAVTTDVT